MKLSLRIKLITILFFLLTPFHYSFSQSKPSIGEKTIKPTLPKDQLPVGSEGPKSNCEQALPSIDFKSFLAPKTIKPTLPRTNNNNINLSATNISVLQKAAEIIKSRPECRVQLQGHGGATKLEQQLSWDRTNVVLRYLVEKTGIAPGRFNFEYGLEGDINMVDISLTSNEGPDSVPAPHPNLRTTGH